MAIQYNMDHLFLFIYFFGLKKKDVLKRNFKVLKSIMDELDDETLIGNPFAAGVSTGGSNE